MIRVVHPVAGAVALLTIATFWLSTALTELFGSKAAIVAVKSAIPWGFLLLIPALAAAGGSGFALAKGARAGLIGMKLKRMPFIAANGLLILIPSALFLAFKAKAGEFDLAFYLVQALELVAGPVNMALLGLNMRDGLKMTGRLGRTASTSEVQLIGRETVADGTMAFRFAKPSGFTHAAGQSVSLTLLDPPETDAQGRSRTFTLACAPYEPDLTVATRMRDTAFKRVLKTLPLGSIVRLTGPNGTMTLHADPARPAVFLAGGIGITPFLAMVRHATHAKLTHHITLFYSSRTLKDAAFLAELQQLEQANPNFHLVATMTDPGSSGHPAWSGETDYIGDEMLRRHLPDVLAPVYYFAGPPAMITAMQKLLKKMSVTEQDMRFEEFFGY